MSGNRAPIDQRYWKILMWLNAANAGMNFKAALKKRHDNTGLWIFDTPQFQELQSAEASIVWLHGIPGCGKRLTLLFRLPSLALVTTRKTDSR